MTRVKLDVYLGRFLCEFSKSSRYSYSAVRADSPRAPLNYVLFKVLKSVSTVADIICLEIFEEEVFDWRQALNKQALLGLNDVAEFRSNRRHERVAQTF